MKRFLIALTCLVALSGCQTPPSNEDTAPSLPNDEGTYPQAAASTASPKKVVSIRGLKIVGTPAPDSKFKNLRPGMSAYAVDKQIGQPDDIRRYTTGKQFIPFYYGRDIDRYTAYYFGSGKLVFSARNDRLIEIHHDTEDSGDQSWK